MGSSSNTPFFRLSKWKTRFAVQCFDSLIEKADILDSHLGQDSILAKLVNHPLRKLCHGYAVERIEKPRAKDYVGDRSKMWVGGKRIHVVLKCEDLLASQITALMVQVCNR